MSHLPFGSKNHSRSAFTLIELLVVIAIIAILAVVVVLTLNPAQLLAQSRDANRVSDMATLNSAINLYQTDQSGASSYSLGATSTAYLSLPATTSNCSSLGVATSAYAYNCSNSSNYRNASSSGWLPIAFNNISSGSPFGSLPVDPVNASSSNLYYSYETNGNQYVLSAFMESQKYAKNMMTTGGIDPALYEIGSGVSTLPNASRGLVGYWPLNEGASSTVVDWSGGLDNGIWHGSAIGSSGYYSSGHLYQWAGIFDGSSTYIAAPSVSVPGPFTYSVWVYPAPSGVSTYRYILARPTYGAGVPPYFLLTPTNQVEFDVPDGSSPQQIISNGYVNASQWTFIAVTFDVNGNRSIYLNGALDKTIASSPYSPINTASTLYIGEQNVSGQYFNGLISDLRIYNRAMSASEIQEMYNAEK